MGWPNSLATLYRDERFVLLGIGLASFGLVRSMVATLTLVRDSNVIPPREPKTQYITQETEDALKLETIDTLLQHPNYPIRDIATSILFERVCYDPEVIRYLLHGITRPDYDSRLRSLQALEQARSHHLGDLFSSLHQKAFVAFVRCLELSLGDHEPVPMWDTAEDDYYFRDQTEKICLSFIWQLMGKCGAHRLVKVHFVERWLAKQNWGELPEQRRRHLVDYMRSRHNRLVDIINQIKNSRSGRRALYRAGLIAKDAPKEPADETSRFVVEFEEGTGRIQVIRTTERSAEEQRLRRQHREAMVLNDGSRPLGRDDIIERHHDSPV